MSSSKTACKRCGAGILQITADLTDGYCMPCANALAWAGEPVSDYVRRRNPEPALNHRKPEEGIILSLAYHPGFTPDLTGWTIQISTGGVLRQEVQWDRRRSQRKEILGPGFLGDSPLAELQGILDRCSSDTFRRLQPFACVDDAATVSLMIPRRQAWIDLPYFHINEGIKKGLHRLDEEEQSSFSLFGKIWSLVDRHAPYSLRMHLKNSRKGGS